MILRLAVRSLATRPLRTAVLAAGFGLGIAVMAELLGVGEVILEQANAPALLGGGDVVVSAATGPLDSARFLLSSVLRSDRLGARVAAASPSRQETLYLMMPGLAVPVTVRGGVPSLERAIGDPEVAGRADWADEPADARWTHPDPGGILRSMDRFHPIPTAATSDPRLPLPRPRASWAEWLYFNGRSADGTLRFYLTFLAGDRNPSGTRPMVVRLQLDRGGRTMNYSASGEVREADLLTRAPNLDVAGNRVRLDGTRYRITLALDRERARPAAGVVPASSRTPKRVPDLTGEIVLEAAPGRSLPPLTIHGARGWESGYVVPALSGRFSGALHANGEDIPLDDVAGYHDHNWGFWGGVHWQWGQVAGGGVSIVYGRLFPPATVADPDHVPGFLGVLGPDGPLGFSTDVTIKEEGPPDVPRTITVQARGRQVELRLALDISESVQTGMALTAGRRDDDPMTFLQLGGTYRVEGRVAGRAIAFTSRGSAETFRMSGR